MAIPEKHEAATRPSPPSTGRPPRVGLSNVERLAARFPAFGAVTLRECLEGMPVPRASNVLERASSVENPEEALRRWARERGLGFYREGRLEEEPKGPARNALFRRLLLKRDEQSLKRRGRGLSEGEVTRLAALFYGPAGRVRMAGISEDLWESYHRPPPPAPRPEPAEAPGRPTAPASSTTQALAAAG